MTGGKSNAGLEERRIRKPRRFDSLRCARVGTRRLPL